jgi:hypothetical protein
MRMKNNYISQLHFISKHLFTLLVLGLLVFGAGSVSGATRTASVSGNWDNTATWGGSSVPIAGDVVTINSGITVTVAADAACSTISFPAGNNVNSTISLNNGITLNVSGTITIPRAANNRMNTLAAGAGFLNAGSIAFTNGGGTNRHQVTITTGTVTVSGNVTSDNTSGNQSASIIFSGTGQLKLGGTFFTPNTGSLTPDLGTVEYTSSTAQSVSNFTYYNLTISGGGDKTLIGATTVTRTLLLIGGDLITSSTNLLTISNTTNSGIMGGSINSYINGPVYWILGYSGSQTTSTYIFPVGKTSYLPFSITGFIPSWNPALRVEAFNASPGGTPDGNSKSISTSEYWKLTTLTSNTYCDFSASTVSIGRGNLIYSYDAIACLATDNNSPAGTYKSLGGTTSLYGVANSAPISPSTTGLNYHYFALAESKTPKITTSLPSFGIFSYIYNFGPSTEQTFIVNGTNLSNNITVTAPANYEISLTPSIGFQSTITLTQSGGNVANKTLYIRLKSGLSIGDYPTINLTLSSGSTSNTIACVGKVFATTPSIITSGGRKCSPNDQIQLNSSSDNVNILYWTGPNNYYSQSPDPLINPADATYNGTYTVTGSIPVGANLIYNGDFEKGLDGVVSSYINNQTSIWGEGTYAVVADPHTVHGNFYSGTDHTPDPGTLEMVVNGATTGNVSIWTQTVNVTPNTDYQFSYWIKSVENTTEPSKLQLYANNQPIGSIFVANTTGGLWTQFFYNWNSGSSTSVVLDMKNKNITGGGNDFALDDIDFRYVTQVSSQITVSANPAANVVISASTGTNLTAGTSVTFSATPTNGGDNPTYVWKVTNGATTSYPTASNSKFIYTPTNGDVVTCVMTSSTDNTCVTGSPATSNSISFIVTTTGGNYWIGTTSTVWSDPSNWTATKVPAPGDNVEFATTVNNSGVAAKKDLYVDYNRIVGSIINNASGKNLVIPADKEVLVNNLITLTPVDAGSTYDQIQVKCDPNPLDASRLPNGSIIFKNASNVNGTVEMYCKANIVAGAANENDRYFWQYFGIPITTVTADPTLYGAYVRRANEAGDDNDATYYWTELTNGDALNAFIGHEICQTNPTVYTFKGQLVNTDFNFTNLAYTSSAKYPGQHLFANPYTAAIDIKKIQLGTDMEQSIFLYNTGSYGQWTTNTGVSSNGSLPGQYISVPLATAGSNNVPGEVPSMSSMLVKTGADKSAQSYMKFNYKDVIIKNSSIQRVKSVDAISSTDLISTMIDLIGQHYSDRMWIFTEPSCTRNFDNGWDGRKILGSSLAPQIYALEPDGDYQVNSVSDMHNTDLAFQAGDEVEYTLKFTHENIQRQYAGVYLVDLVENKTVDVSQNGSTYTFATAQSDAPAKRFKILTRPYEKGAPDMEAQVKIFTAPGRVFVHNLSSSKGDCTLYDIAGRAIKNAPFAANAVTEVLNNLTPGAYVVNAIANGEKVSKRVIVQ